MSANTTTAMHADNRLAGTLPRNPLEIRRLHGSIHDTLSSLAWVVGELQGAGDARAIFPDVYGIITRNVTEALPTDFFQAPEIISRLAGRFGSLYLETLVRSAEGRHQTSAAWELAYERAKDADALPVEHAALGINAHINFDLALGIYQIIEELGIGSDLSTLNKFKHDHDAVNEILEKSLPQCLDRLIAQYGCPATPLLTRRAQRFINKRIMAALAGWREQVWDNVLALVAAQDVHERIAVIQRMDREAARQGKLIS
ncbi:MAG TPA: DUF5995 family protein, partial [Myxococcaceae bacterium]|nr:DUF5995 family protein [Myxococcaceae bacterium]